MDAKMPRAVDTFSGCGGLTTELKQAGFKVVAAVESEKGALTTYKMNHADVAHVYGMDIREVSGTRLLRDLKMKRGELDLLAGCRRAKASRGSEGTEPMLHNYNRTGPVPFSHF